MRYVVILETATNDLRIAPIPDGLWPLSIQPGYRASGLFTSVEEAEQALADRDPKVCRELYGNATINAMMAAAGA